MDSGIISARARGFAIVAGALLLSACVSSSDQRISRNDYLAIETALSRDISTLASEEFAGRRPGTLGEAYTLKFIEDSLKSAGYVSGTNDPANPWRAPVELVSTTPSSYRVELQVGRRRYLVPAAESAGFTTRKRSLVEKAPMLFVGRLAEEVAGEDVLGRVAVILSDPGKSPARRDILFEKGAVAIITVVDTEDDIWDVSAAYSSEKLILPSEENGALSAFVTASAMSGALGKNRWEGLLASEQGSDFSPSELPALATVEANSIRREVRSNNLIGLLPGKQPGSGAILLLAHWDHFGECGQEGDKDRLCNGAVDNASGVAVMLELARRLAKDGPFDRDIYVLGTTAEESGLLGVKAFVDQPPIPLDSIIAAFNFDTVAVAPRGTNVGFVGEGQTVLDAPVMEAIEKSGRLIGNRSLADLFLQRQDGWILLQKGVPAVAITSAMGDDQVLNRFLDLRYHKANDEPEVVELGGAIEDLLLHERLISRLANVRTYSAPAN